MICGVRYGDCHIELLWTFFYHIGDVTASYVEVPLSSVLVLVRHGSAKDVTVLEVYSKYLTMSFHALIESLTTADKRPIHPSPLSVFASEAITLKAAG